MTLTKLKLFLHTLAIFILIASVYLLQMLGLKIDLNKSLNFFGWGFDLDSESSSVSQAVLKTNKNKEQI